MNLQELGAVFKQERERRGLSVEDVVQRTKISRRNLLAIEAGRKEDLPHPVYAKGFVKNYARLLGLDPEEYAAALSREYFVADNDFGNDPTRDKPISMTAARNVGGQGRRSLRGLLLLLLVAAVAGAVLWSTVLAPRRSPAPLLSAPQAAPAAPEAAPQAPSPVVAAEPSAEPGVTVPPADQPPVESKAEAAPAQAAPLVAEPAPKPAPEPAKPVPATPAVEPAKPAVESAKPEAEAPPVPAAEPALSAGVRIMEIKASQLCWVNAEVDGSIVLDMLLQPGEAKSIHFDKALTVKFGNAGGVKVTLDNRPFPLNAQSGEVRTVTIP